MHDEAYFTAEGSSSKMFDMHTNFMSWKHLLQHKLL